MQSEYFPLNTPFKPSAALIPWFIINFLLMVVFISVFVLIPLFLFESLSTFLWALGGMASIIVLFMIWTKLYYDSMWYELHEDEMRWKRGVLFRRTGIVP